MRYLFASLPTTMAISLWTIFLGLVVEVYVVPVEGVGFSGIPGRYCSIRNPGCCTSRNDSCSVVIMGTQCYCDEFCDRRAVGEIPDCCPDFYEHCRGQIREHEVETTSTTTSTTIEPWTLPTSRAPLKEPEIVKGDLLQMKE